MEQFRLALALAPNSVREQVNYGLVGSHLRDPHFRNVTAAMGAAFNLPSSSAEPPPRISTVTAIWTVSQ